MKRRGFILNSLVLVLLIPMLLLLATYEDVTSWIVKSQSERVQVERTFRVTSYLEEDFKNALELSTKRALSLAVDFVTNEHTPIDNASKAIKELILRGTYPQLSGYSRVSLFMGNNTLRDWIINLRDELSRQGYVLSPSVDEILSSIQVKVVPLDSFHVVVNASIPNILIQDISGKVVYNSSLPQDGSIYAVVSIEGMEDPLFSYLTYGKYSRIVSSCKFMYPNLAKPIKAIEGYGSSNIEKFSGQVSVSLENLTSNKIYVGEYYTEKDALGYIVKNQPGVSVDNPIIFNTTINNIEVSPLDVFEDGDIAVMAFGNISGAWCPEASAYEYRVEMNISSLEFQPNALTLLEIPASVLSGAYHNGTIASIRVYDVDCNPIPFWIEKWGNDEILIWIKTGVTNQYFIYYTADPAYAIDGYNKETLFDLYDDFDGTSIDTTKWDILGSATVDGNGTLIVSADEKASVLESKVSFNYPIFVRYKMKSTSGTSDFDAGVAVVFGLQGGERLLVNVTYAGEQIPDYTNIQIPIKLEGADFPDYINAQDNTAEIKIYDNQENELPFWIEYWNTTEEKALIWVKSSFIYDRRQGNTYYYHATFYIEYNTGTLTRGNGTAVFEFFDNFEDSTWDDKWELAGGTDDNIEQTNGNLIIKNGNSLLALRNNVDLNLYGDYAIRFKMKPSVYSGDWDAGIGIEDFNVRDGSYDTLLFTDDVQPSGDYLAIHRAWWRWTWREGETDTISQSRGDANFHTYEVQVFPDGNDVYFYDLTNGRENYDARQVEDPLYRIYLVLDNENNENWAYYDWIFLRKYLDEDSLSYNVQQVSSVQSVPMQYIDDNPGNVDHNGDLLAILQNWTSSLASSSTSSDLTIYRRYEVIFNYDSGGISTTFSDLDDTSRVTSASVATSPQLPLKIQIIIDNTMDNSAYFDWIIAGRYPYVSTQPQYSSPESKASVQSGKNARAYNIQPYIDCIQEYKYFGVSGYPSFFERLEGGATTNRAYYETLAEKTQEVVYGEAKYPIGIVSFILPKDLPPNLGFLVRKQPAVDSIYLDYENYRGDRTDVYKVLGISSNGGVATPIIDENFYLDYQIATAIFGRLGAQDLLVSG
ncbi:MULTISPECIES: DUF2341 domain-containing protein [Thermococcus]|uniref:DUF2341 domain-containing protein n=2 Tax=Thermococcus sibiricus TaxID=172049 RepID=C6A0G8_THESM|nr:MULTISPECIES: DUF2341 domain-containing protein [Thermococcus]KUK28785.1 MAG: Uncharacterized protein XD61_0657 [Thermococcus sp. 40_45]HII67512.1 DUF2341 domain-containing protein [Thermococcaceae archaeon]ACS89113.1 hypothetical protein TSIB_0042 [Thermococcus sibiricus MM 739]KUK18103.1 MAG: Uncharacterized protein XD54_0610 [Thermococcus sibiricus]MBC7095829.1 DUF2341 domain-containing protein [Thermococcus sp.]